MNRLLTRFRKCSNCQHTLPAHLFECSHCGNTDINSWNQLFLALLLSILLIVISFMIAKNF